MRLRGWLPEALGGALLALGASALGGPTEEPIQLSYEAPPGCGSIDAFWARVRARTQRARWAQADPSARRFVVSVTAGPRSVRGRLTVLEPSSLARRERSSHPASGDSVSLREIEAPSCDEALDGLAFIAALAVDPSRSQERTPRSDAGPTPGPGKSLSDGESLVGAPPGGPGKVPAAPISTRPAPSAAASSRPVEAVASPTRPAADGGPETSRPPSRPEQGEILPPSGRDVPASDLAPSHPVRGDQAHVEWRVLAEGYVRVGMAPGALGGAGLGLQLRGVESSSRALWAPSVSLVASGATRPGFDVQGATASFRYFGAATSICGVRFPVGPFALAPCAAANLGVEHVWGTGAPVTRTRSRLWADGGAEARLAWRATRALGLELHGAVLVPLRRDRFLFGSEKLYSVPSLGSKVGLDLALAIP